MQQLLDQLNSRNPAVRDAALRDARALPPEELLELVLLERQLKRSRTKQGWLYHNLFFLVTMLLILLVENHMPKSFGMVFPFVSASINLLRQSFTQKYSRAQTLLGTLLSEIQDVRFVVPMLSLQKGLTLDESKELRKTLIRLLPQVRADHGAQWSKEDKAELVLVLKYPNIDVALTLACLKALEQVGDASAVSAVKKLTNASFRKKEINLWQAAQECLLYLESNTTRFQQAETLLRSSDAVATRPEMLLRAAHSAPDITLSEQLLRPNE